MKIKRSSVPILFLLTLLFSQVSSSFALPMISLSSDAPCNMAMEHHGDSHGSNSAMTMEHISQDTDCCDTHDMSNCAEGQCDCVVLPFVVVIVDHHVPEQVTVNATKAPSELASFVLTAYSAPLIRPPIRLAY